MEEKEVQCGNCKKMLPESKLPLHEGYCYRNYRKCELCDEFIDINNKEDHIEEFHKMVKCPECSQEVEISKMEAHKQVCPMKKKYCAFCKLEVLAKDFETHVDHCGSRTDKCQFCNKNIMLKQMELHEATCLEEQAKERERAKVFEAKRKEEERKKREAAERNLLRQQELKREMEEKRIKEERQKALQEAQNQERLRKHREEELKKQTAQASYTRTPTQTQASRIPAVKPTSSGYSGYANKVSSQNQANPSGLTAHRISRPNQGISTGNSYASRSSNISNTNIPAKPTRTQVVRPSGNTNPPARKETRTQSYLKTQDYHAMMLQSELESEKLAKQLQQEYDQKASEKFLSRQAQEQVQENYGRTKNDTNLARRLQEEMDRELAEKLAREAEAEQAQARSQNQARAAENIRQQPSMPTRPPPTSSFSSDSLDGLYGQGYGMPARSAPQNYPQNTAVDDLEEDEAYQRAVMESLALGKQQYR